jgi:hypothetical protein
MEAAIVDEPELLAHGPVTEWIDIHYEIDREDAPAEAVR